jgi:DNA-binding response OmpR family regulator
MAYCPQDTGKARGAAAGQSAMTQPDKILVVDDDPMFVRMLQSHLDLAGYRTCGAYSGRETLDVSQIWLPDLVLLDVMMPSMDGYTVCRRLREFTPASIILVTAKAEEDDRVSGLDAGADDYIVKPFSIQELLARVRAVLRRAALRRSTESCGVISHHELQMNFADGCVMSGGRQVRLSPSELKLLEALASPIGRLISPEELLSRVWGHAYREDRAILWITLCRLRQKIEPNPRRPIHVVTRTRLGYSMPPVEAEPAPASFSQPAARATLGLPAGARAADM